MEVTVTTKTKKGGKVVSRKSELAPSPLTTPPPVAVHNTTAVVSQSNSSVSSTVNAPQLLLKV